MHLLLEAIQKRVSTPRLLAPAPSREEVMALLECAVRAPDHGRLRPWRFLVVEGEGLKALGLLFVDAAQSTATAPLDEAARERLRTLPLRSPMIIIAMAKVKPIAKVPAIEQVLAVGAAVENLLLAAQELGYGTMWRTGEMAFHPYVKEKLGLAAEDQIVGFIYIGTADDQTRPAAPADLATLVQWWQ
jgi:nitroreductase